MDDFEYILHTTPAGLTKLVNTLMSPSIKFFVLFMYGWAIINSVTFFVHRNDTDLIIVWYIWGFSIYTTIGVIVLSGIPFMLNKIASEEVESYAKYHDWRLMVILCIVQVNLIMHTLLLSIGCYLWWTLDEYPGTTLMHIVLKLNVIFMMVQVVMLMIPILMSIVYMVKQVISTIGYRCYTCHYTTINNMINNTK
jgi:hypothetical protein